MVTVLPAEALPLGESVESEHVLDLDPIPKFVSVARAFVAEHAPALEPDTHDTIVLLTSELVTNVVIHARTPLRVGIAVTQHAVIVSVHDLDLGHREPDATEREGGRGLMLVEALADASGMHVFPGGGKTAWFRVTRGPAPDAASDTTETPHTSDTTETTDAGAAHSPAPTAVVDGNGGMQ